MAVYSRMTRGAFALVLAAVVAMCALAFAPPPALAATGNEAGATFEVACDDADGDGTADGTLTYTVLEAASTDEGGVAVNGKASLSSGSAFAGASLTVPAAVYQTVDGTHYDYDVVAVGEQAFINNKTLKGVTFSGSLPGYGSSNACGLGKQCFYRCSNLITVTFDQGCESIASIGDEAFYRCTSLTSVIFENDHAVLCTFEISNGQTKSYASAIGERTFAYCTSLSYIEIPAITGAYRKGDAYYTAYEYDPTNPLVSESSPNGTSDPFPDGIYTSYWHENVGPVMKLGIPSTVFTSCNKLETVVFSAGNPIGAFAYWASNASPLANLKSLKNVVYDCAQPWWGDPNGSGQNMTSSEIGTTGTSYGGSYDAWANYIDDDGNLTIGLYYAVDFYATSEAADTDDAWADGAAWHVNLKRDTPIADISAGTVADEYVYSAQLTSEGASPVPDPNEAAKTLLGEDFEEDAEYVWHLTDTQQHRVGLTESCRAYLAKKGDIAGGRIANDEEAALFTEADRTMSQGFDNLPDTAYDPTHTILASGRNSGAVEYIAFVVGSRGIAGLIDELDVRTATGEQVDLSRCSVSFRVYEDDELKEDDGALHEGSNLVTITPDDDYEGLFGTFYEWIYVSGNSGSVKELYTDAAADTADAATNYDSYGSHGGPSKFADAPYRVQVGASDSLSALMAAGYAGIAGARIVAVSSDDADYGFTLDNGKSGTDAKELAYSRDVDSCESPAAYAVWAYNDFTWGTSGNASGRNELGLSDDCAWGDVAVIVNPWHIDDVAAAAAAYAYAKGAPVFYLEDDGSLGASTLSCLKNDFGKVVAIGDESLFSAEAFSALEAAGLSAERIEGDAGSACALTLAVAEALMADTDANSNALAGLGVVTVSDGADPLDAIGALNCSGFEGGVTLVSNSTADSKRISSWLRARRDDVSVVRLFGREGGVMDSEAFDLCSSLETLWSEDGYAAPSVAAGDTLELSGALFSIGVGNALTWTADIWEHDEVAAGAYDYDGQADGDAESYTLSSAADAYGWAADGIGISDGSVVLQVGEAGSVSVAYGGLSALAVSTSPEGVVEAAYDAESGVLTLAGAAAGTATVTLSDGRSRSQVSVAVTKADPSAVLGPSTEDNTAPYTSPNSVPGTNTNTSTGSGTATNTGTNTTTVNVGGGTTSTGATTGTISAGTATVTSSGTGSTGTGTSTGTSASSSSGTSSGSGSTSGSSTGTSGRTSGVTLDLGESTDESTDSWLSGSTGDGTSGSRTDLTLNNNTGSLDADDDSGVAWDDERTDEGASGSSGDSGSGISPVAVGVGVAAAVAAVGAVLWYVLRRKDGSDDIDMEFSE